MTRRFLFPLLLAIGALLLCTPALRAENEGQDDLDQATEKKLSAQSIGDLSQVIELCESAMEKGLDGTNKQFAKNLLTGTLLQRATFLMKQVVDPRVRPRGWQQQRLNAISDLEKAINNDPKLVPAYLMMAQLQAMPTDRNHPGDLEAAKKTAQQAFDAADQPEQRVAALVLQAKLTDDNEKRLDLYGQALKIAPANQQVLAERGITLLAAGKSEEALTDLTAAVKSDPENPQVQLARALALSVLNRNDEALEAIDQAVKLVPDDPTPYMHRARILMQQKKYDDALTALGRVLEIDPDSVAALLFRAQVYQKSGNLDAARADVNEALRHRPGLVEAIQLHGVFAAGAGEYHEAIDDFEKLLKFAPKNPQLLTQLGLLYGLDKRPRKAIEMYTEALAVDPQSFLALRGRADAYLNIGKHAEAIPDYDAALKIEPKDSSLLNNLAWVLATSPDDKVRNGKRSIELGEQAAQATDYKKPHILSTLAAGYAETGDFAKAREWSQKAVDLGSEEKETAEQLRKELASYQAEKPWRERQVQEENDGSKPAAKDSSTTQAPATPDNDSAAAKDASTRKQ